MLIYKVIGAITAAAISAAVVMALPGFSPELQASTGNPGQVLKTDLGLVVFFQAADFTSQSVPPKADRIVHDFIDWGGPAQTITRRRRHA